MACTDIGTSPYPVMKMIGMSGRSAVTSFCRSRPLRSGRLTSRTRQLGTRGLWRERNSCADANVSGCQPADSISSSRDSRTETSSSTTNTIGLDVGDDSPSGGLARPIGPPRESVADLSARSKSCMERPQQRRLAERLEQALDRAPLEHLRTDGLV